jgi:hypothetical protein
MGTLPPSPGDLWRVNLYSFKDGQRAALAWSPLLREGSFHRTRRFGKIQFVDPNAAKPSASASASGSAAPSVIGPPLGSVRIVPPTLVPVRPR